MFNADAKIIDRLWAVKQDVKAFTVRSAVYEVGTGGVTHIDKAYENGPGDHIPILRVWKDGAIHSETPKWQVPAIWYFPPQGPAMTPNKSVGIIGCEVGR